MSLIPRRVPGGARAKAASAALALGALGGIGFMAAPAQASTVIGTEYQHASYGGAFWNVTVSPNGFTCTTSTGNVDAEIGSIGGWNDFISSFKTYSNCWAKHYEHNFYGGASVGYSGSQSYIGNAMNDRTSSIRWS